MKKLHVDEILKKREEGLPGPDRYTLQNFKGIGKEASAYSIRKKYDDWELKLEKNKNIPGPGHYDSGDLFQKKLNNSVMTNSATTKFSKA